MALKLGRAYQITYQIVAKTGGIHETGGRPRGRGHIVGRGVLWGSPRQLRVDSLSSTLLPRDGRWHYFDPLIIYRRR